MAITPSVIPLGTPGGAAAGNADTTATAEGATPGGFLGLIGNLASPPQVAAPVAAPVATVATTLALATASEGQAATLLESMVGALAGLAPDELQPPAKPLVDEAASPEATAAAMAVMAQMLASTQTPATPMQPSAQAVEAKSASPSAEVPVLATPAITTTAPQATDALRVAAAPTLATSPSPLAVEAPSTPTPVGMQDASAVLAGQGAALALPQTARPIAADPRTPPPETDGDAQPVIAASTDSTRSSAFQSLTALLSAGARNEAAAKAATQASSSPAADGTRLGAFSTTLATAPMSGDAATAEAQQPVLIREPVGTAQWADSIGARLTMMATRGEQHGSLRLSPEHLGPVEVQIRTQDDGKASVWFGAHHADTRVALQDSLPRLRELFAAQGMQLGDAGVSRDPPRQQAAGADARSSGAGNAGVDPSGIEDIAVALPTAAAIRHAGLLDTYA